MKSVLLFAAALAATATVASADVTPGKAQFAATLGLDPAAYTLTELSLINDAARANNREAVKYYLNHENRKPVSSAEVVTPAEAQLAARLGLDASDYTQAELDQIDSARRANNREREAFYLSHTNRQGTAAAETASPAELQLAARLGLDASLYTQAELDQIEAARSDNNREKEAFYINHVNRRS